MTDRNERKEYWNTVKAIAQDIKDEWKRDHDLDVDQMTWESVDGSCYIIYYARNLTVLVNSDNSDAIDDHGIEIDTSKGWKNILTQVAFFAMLSDVQGELEELGYDSCNESFDDEDEDEEDDDQ